MSKPNAFDAASIRKKRLNILNKLKPVKQKNFSEVFLQGQYQGYKKINGVNGKSKTETYFEHIAFINDKRWEGVPILMSSGKALAESKVEVMVNFKDITDGPFRNETCTPQPNQIKLTISPEQSMHVTLNAKQPGLGYQLESRTLSFKCEAGSSEIKNSYERVLLDCIKGDRTLFTSNAEVMAAWKYINNIMKFKEKLPLYSYKKGSNGPKNKLAIKI